MLPQLRMMQKAKVVEKFTAHYVFVLGLSRFISCAHWILQVLRGGGGVCVPRSKRHQPPSRCSCTPAVACSAACGADAGLLPPLPQILDGDKYLWQALGSGLWPVMVLVSEIVQVGGACWCGTWWDGSSWAAGASCDVGLHVAVVCVAGWLPARLVATIHLLASLLTSPPLPAPHSRRPLCLRISASTTSSRIAKAPVSSTSQPASSDGRGSFVPFCLPLVFPTFAALPNE